MKQNKKIYSLDHGKITFQCMYYVTQYLETIHDIKNVEMCCSKFKGNTERFEFNPIRISDTTRKLFPKLKQLHLYTKDDPKFESDFSIEKRYLLCEIGAFEASKLREIQCLKIIFTKRDILEYSSKIPSFCLSIQNNCFEQSFSLEQIILPEGITSIGNQCFRKCSKLTKVILPQSLKVIGENCFTDCIHLPFIIIPDNVVTIGHGAFSGCTSLVCVQLSSSIVTIENGIFSDCYSLEELRIPENVTRIDNLCVERCKRLTSLLLPKKWKICGNKIMDIRPILSTFDIPSTVKLINHHQFIQKDMNEFTVPSMVTSISNNCFHQCKQLTSISIPSTVKILGQFCFIECISLKSIVLPDSITELQQSTFAKCSTLQTITLPSNLKRIRNRCFAECKSMKSIQLPSTVTFLGNSCFIDFSSLASISFTHPNIIFEDFVFDNCDKLKILDQEIIRKIKAKKTLNPKKWK